MQSLAILGLARYASHTGGNTAVDTATLQKLHGEDNAYSNLDVWAPSSGAELRRPRAGQRPVAFSLPL